MKTLLCFCLIASGLVGCVDRYPDSQYLSTYGSVNNGTADTTTGV